MIHEIEIPKLPVGRVVERGIDWMTANWSAFFDGITAFVSWVVGGVTDLLVAVPEPVMIVLFALLAWVVRSWRLAAGTLLAFGVIWSMGLWTHAMQTLALVLMATLFAVVIAVPLGIAAARSDRVSAIVKPVLDLMQTMPAFVYLIPAITFFGIGVVPGVLSTLIFALPPGVRMTELGIRSVDSETVEAGHSFGATPWQILRGIQLPLAVPTIMAGVNQVIMLALSMAVIAGMVGADGLGKDVTAAIASLNTAQGVEAGLAVVFLAIYLDRLTDALGRPSEYAGSLMARLRRSGMAPRRRHALMAGIAALALAVVAAFSIVDPGKIGGGSKGKIVIGNIPAWTDIRSTAYLWGNRLEAMGYEVEYQVLSEPAPLYAGLARGDIDLNPSAWSDVTHKQYMDKYRKDLEQLGTFNASAMNMLAVPEYSSLDSIEDLKGKQGQYGGRIVGIEPGAGLTNTTQTKVIPEYGLQDYELVTSSTTAMLAELQNAIKKKDDIVVTLWKPYWATSKFPVKELKDPKKAFGSGEGMNILGAKGFSEEFPDAAEFLSKAKLSDDQYGDLENTVVNEFGEGQEEEAIEAWLERNPDVLPPVEG